MPSLKTKYLIILILFVCALDASLAKEEIDISISSEPNSGNDDYVALKVGDKLKIWCKATEPMRGMRIEHIDFYSNDFVNKSFSIPWKDSLEWDRNTFKHEPFYNIYELNFKYIMLLDIKYVTLEHRGWQICYINEYVYIYVYVYVNDEYRKFKNSYKLIKSKPNSRITIPCISPNPNFSINFLYHSYLTESLEVVPGNQIYKYNDRIGFQVAPISNLTKYFCCYSIRVFCLNVILIIETDEDEQNVMPMFNEDYSAITSIGTDLKMECILINSKNLSISFLWNTPTFNEEMNKTHINDLKIEVMENTTIHISSLTIKNVTANDFGFYKCSVINFEDKEIGFARRQIFKKVNTAYKKNSIKYFNGTKIRIIENENCVLMCEAFYPITWNYDLSEEKNSIPKNVFINSSFNNKTLTYQSILNIRLATYKNNGFYYCTEMNVWNEIENTLYQKKIFVYVLKDTTTTPVSFSLNERITEIYVQKHSPYVTVPCIPRTTRNYICDVHNLNQNKIKSDKEYNQISFEYVYDTDVDDDLAFECSCPVNGENNFEYAYIDNLIFIKVYESFHEKTLPYINLKYNKNVTVGEELKLNCTILRYCKQCKSNERLNVTWSYNVNSTNITQRISKREKYIPLYNAELYLSTLVIKNAQKTDSYEYKCSDGNLSSNMNVIVFDEEIFVNYIIVSLIITTFVLITVIAILALFFKQVKLQNKIRKAGLSNFNKGVKGILNPKLYINLQADMLPYDTKLEIPRNKIKIGLQLGSGNFGLVFKGQLFDQSSGETVAIKMIKSNLKYEHMKILITELKILSILGKHLNVINLLGACTENLDRMELLVILEYCHYGNIRDILRNNRNDFLNLINSNTSQIVTPTSYANINCSENVENIKENSNYNEQITTNTLINWAYQISAGMKFMASRKVLHGDLAARNILLNENNIVKICDFGLSKNLAISYIYKKKTQCPLPIKWMAIESIRDKTFSTQSDVWSFGVVLWELFSLAQTPYPNLRENMEFFQLINDGYRMEQPEYSTQEIYQMMLKCWEHDPKLRPSFSLINFFLESYLEKTFRNHYLELSNAFGAELKSKQQQKYLETSF